jgi:predicted TPR repeat methyltransferase
MFNKSADFYDAIYQNKNYAVECEKIDALIQQHKQNAAKTLLDIACGTGLHASGLKLKYSVEGLDIEKLLLDRAKERNPDMIFHCADMTEFDLHRRYDVITCLFSSIGYVGTVQRLHKALVCMLEHLNSGGLLLVEPWFTPETYYPGRVHALFVDRPELKIARMNVSAIRESISIIDFHYLVATTDGVEGFSEKHELALFTHEQMMSAFRIAGFNEIRHDPIGLTDRGLYVGLKG